MTCCSGDDGAAADGAGRELHVLPADLLQDFGGAHAEAAQLVGVQPDAHRVGRAELVRRAHAGDALDRIENLRRNDVVELGGCRAAVRRAHAERDDESLVHLGNGQALHHHFAGQPGFGQLHPVLGLQHRDVGIGAVLEHQGDARAAVGVGRRGEVQQLVETGQLLLDDLRDGAFDGVGVRARIERIDRDLRRRDVRIGRRRQARDREAAAHHDEDGDDPGQHRPIDEIMRQHA